MPDPTSAHPSAGCAGTSAPRRRRRAVLDGQPDHLFGAGAPVAGRAAAALTRTPVPDRSSEPRYVVDPSAIRCLVDSEHLMYLGVFIDREGSVAAAARELGVPFARAYVRVRTLERVGLLRKHRLRRRKGRPITTYVAAASQFEVPLEVLFGAREVVAVENRWHDRFVKALEQQAMRHLARGTGGGLRVALRGGRLSARLVDAAGDPVLPSDPPGAPLSWGWASLRLLDHDARELSRDLDDLRERCYSKHQAGGSPFVVGLHLAPLEE